MGANIDFPEGPLMNAHAFRHFYDYHFAENRKIWEKISSCGKCFSMWLITAQIIAHKYSDCSTI